MSSSSDSSCSASSISESETMNSSSEVVGVSSSLRSASLSSASLQRDASLEAVLEATLDDSISEGDWETGFIFLPEIIFWKLILGESMCGPKGKILRGKRGK